MDYPNFCPKSQNGVIAVGEKGSAATTLLGATQQRVLQPPITVNTIIVIVVVDPQQDLRTTTDIPIIHQRRPRRVSHLDHVPVGGEV